MSQENLIPIAGPWITEKEIEAVTQAAQTSWYGGAGKAVRDFEAILAKSVQRKFALALPHCTSGLHLILRAANIGPGDEVILPDITWIASAAPVEYVGATPVFCDVDPLTWCLTPSAIQRVLTRRTRAIISVDLYGGMPDYEPIEKLAREHGLLLIEDAAEAIGSRYRERPAGNFGSASVFSFHGSKTVTTGEGGMLLLDDETLYERCCFLRDHGRPPGDRFFQNTEVAYKYKMSDLQAALGHVQMTRLDELVARKRQIFAWYAEHLHLPGTRLNYEPPDVFNTYWMSSLVWDESHDFTKFELMQYLRERKIDTRPFFSQLSNIPAYKGRFRCEENGHANVVAKQLSERGINLPSALCLTREQVTYTCDAVRDFFQERRRS
jgi:perosamine synthetase